MTHPSTSHAPFVFDNDYDNLDQVAHLWDAYAARYRELEKAGTYPYNDLFKGHLEGLVADDRNEDTAIYLLQVTRRKREYEEQVRSLREQGYTEPTVDPGSGNRLTKYASVAIVGLQYRQYGRVQVVDGGRVHTRDGIATTVLPKGARTRGYRVPDGGYVLVKRK